MTFHEIVDVYAKSPVSDRQQWKRFTTECLYFNAASVNYSFNEFGYIPAPAHAVGCSETGCYS